MPSPFPGMDPFIEQQRWMGFHITLLTVVSELLVSVVRPRYFVEIGKYVYPGSDDEEPAPDLSVVDLGAGTSGNGGAVATLKPAIHTLPAPKRRQAFLTLRTRDRRDVVTVIELLSPWNKTPGDGRGEYLAKRANVLAVPANLVEIDLLRGGQRLPTKEPLASADFHAFVTRKATARTAEVYSWQLRDPLPVIPVPLAGGDPDVGLDLQRAFVTTYDRAGYDYALDYRRSIEPPLDEATERWARSLASRP